MVVETPSGSLLTHREGYYGYWVFDQVAGLDIGYLTAIDP